MKRVVRSKSGREIFGPKWQNNMEYLNISHSSDSDRVSVTTEAPPVTETNVVENEDQTQSSQGGINRRANLSALHQSMYRACVEGDCVAAEMLVEGYPNLGCDEISEEGDRALHIAVSMKHCELVRKLVERMRPSELALLDGHGYTACCYAAISDSVEIGDFMMKKNPTLATARDRENKTPLQKAALRANAKMVSHFLKSAKAKAKDLSIEEWFDLLLVTIRRKLYGVALEILGINEQLATMSNDAGTALHLLAGKRFYKTRWERMNGVMRGEIRMLAEKLWTGINQNLEQCSVVELMKKPPILHIAAKVGNIELITMFTHTYPHLVWLTDNKGYTIFHIAVKHRHEGLFGLINEIGAKKDLIALWQDENGNNILHLVGELAAPKRQTIWVVPAFEMQKELMWLEKVKETVPPLCLEMKNKEGETARELFFKRKKRFLEESRTWLKNVSNSCMLISTIIFTVVFGSAFAVPGGYNQDTGAPILLDTFWFTCFIIFEALAMLLSAFSILCFLRIMMTGMKEVKFVRYEPTWFLWGLNALAVSVLAVICVFMTAYFLVYVKERAAPRAILIEFLIASAYCASIFAVFSQIHGLHANLPKHRFRKQTRHTLFKPPDAAVMPRKRRCWIF